MTDFTRGTSRDARALTNNRKGNTKFHDNTYHVTYGGTDTKVQQHQSHILPFQKTGGHIMTPSPGIDLHYNDLTAFHRLHNRFYHKGSIEFDKMGGPNHEHAFHDLRFPNAAVNSATSVYAAGSAGGRYCFTGEPFTTTNVAESQIRNKYARDIGTTRNRNWDKMLSREDRDKGKDRARQSYSSTRLCGLHISYKAVDIEADHVVRFDPDGRHRLQRERRERELRATARMKREMEKRMNEMTAEKGGGEGDGDASVKEGERVSRDEAAALIGGVGTLTNLHFKQASQRSTAFTRLGNSKLVQETFGGVGIHSDGTLQSNGDCGGGGGTSEAAVTSTVALAVPAAATTQRSDQVVLKGNGVEVGTTTKSVRVPHPPPPQASRQLLSSSSPSRMAESASRSVTDGNTHRDDQKQPGQEDTIESVTEKGHIDKQSVNAFDPFSHPHPLLLRKSSAAVSSLPTEGATATTTTTAVKRPSSAVLFSQKTNTQQRPESHTAHRHGLFGSPAAHQQQQQQLQRPRSASSAVPSFVATGDPIAAFNKNSRVISRQLSFAKADRFGPSGQRYA